MAEQCNGSLLTPGKDKFGGVQIGKNAARIPCFSERITRSLSFGSYDSGKTGIRNSGEKQNSPHATIPHYLQASPGSCHDICKYGRRRAFEEKATIPLRKASAKPSLDELNSKEMVEKHDEPSEDLDKHSLLVKPSPDAKSFSPKAKASLDARTLSRRLNASSFYKARLPTSSTEKSTSLETTETIERDVSLSEDSVDNKMAIADKKTFDQSLQNSSSLRSKQVVVCRKRRTSYDVQTGGKMRTPLFPKAKKSGSVKLLSPVKDRNRMDGVESVKYPLESAPDNHDIPASPASLGRASSVFLSHEEEDEEIKYNTETDEVVSDNATSIEIRNLKPVKKKQNILASANPSSHVSLSHVGNDAEIDMLQPTKENDKTLAMSALPSSKPLSRSKADKRVSGNTITVKITKAKPLKGNHNKNLGKGEVVSSGDKYCRPVKSKFRSEKIVNLRQDDNRVPIRLKFRKRRVSDPKADGSASETDRSIEIGNVRFLKKNNKTLRKSRSEVKSRSPGRLIKGEKGPNLQSDNAFPKRLRFRRPKNLGIEDGKCDFKRTSKNTEILSGKVNLKHQDVKGNNHAQRSFNNVIKETASKLVESRKSKVKALVGAFETVISLQEGKPSPHIAN